MLTELLAAMLRGFCSLVMDVVGLAPPAGRLRLDDAVGAFGGYSLAHASDDVRGRLSESPFGLFATRVSGR